MGELFDEPSALVAAAHSHFAHHYLSVGDLPKASNAAGLALRILDNLIRNKPHEREKDGVHYASLYVHVLMTDLDVSPQQYVVITVNKSFCTLF
jgi:hypothetical protein